GGFKRKGAGRGNWGTQSDYIARVTDELSTKTQKIVAEEKPARMEDAAAEEKEPADK
ncbi:plasminogen activator inhibitor 1 RNA-binding protein-like, partial [Trifolium medium]|nr:plasminogen activator inhibitor 1 RNA-binding protein-like [Trifolium medium]